MCYTQRSTAPEVIMGVLLIVVALGSVVGWFIKSQTAHQTNQLKRMADNPSGRKVSPEVAEMTERDVMDQQAQRWAHQDLMSGRRYVPWTPLQKASAAFLGYQLIRHTVWPHHHQEDPHHGFDAQPLDGQG
jgi:hypothetical protein